MNRDVCGTCGCPYGDDGRCGCEAVNAAPDLQGFCRAILDGWPMYAPDWVEMHDLLRQHGLLIETVVTAPCGEQCECAAENDPDTLSAGVTCYRLHPSLRG